MSNLHCLLIYLAVVVSGTPITRYATFRNLDMTNPCHVGVLAKSKDGTTWVIQSNGNGTYSMAWDEYTRKWGLHKIKISEWLDSADGTTLEGAVGVGNLNYDEMLDNCYDTRDTVVGYLSGRNNTLSVLTAQICPPNKRYCGYDPEVQAIVNIKHSHGQKVLLSCGDDGRIARVDICDRNCASNGGHGRCPCSPDMPYCGHELNAIGGWMDYDNHTLYMCLDGINVSIIHRCPNGCVSKEGNSICSGYCTPNNFYCGLERLEMGLKGYHPNVVYQCDASGQSTRIIANCSEGCWVQSPGNANCLCHPGRIYCVHELYTQMNWVGVKDEYAIDPNTTGMCLPNKFKVKWIVSCTNCIASQGEKDAYCQWTPGPVCGLALNAMGWKGHEVDTLYQCGEERGNISIISMCNRGTCRIRSCNCIPKRTYCGHQLYSMGWRKLDLKEEGNLWQCFPNGDQAKVISQCKRCTNLDGQAKCACQDTELYCGYELDADPPLEDNGVYRCSKNGSTSLVKICKHSCIRIGVVDNVIFNKALPDCLGECTPGETYCGSKLLTIGYTGYNNNSIYLCSNNGQNLTIVKNCSTGCIITSEKVSICSGTCTPERAYCGWTLLEMGLKGYDSKAVHRCDASGQSATTIANCSEECGEGAGVDGIAFCQCHPGRMYCAHELSTQMNWWMKPPMDPHRSGQCQPDKQGITWRFVCINCVASQGEKDAYCQWTHGVLCGRKLNEMGWPGHDNDTLYQCGVESGNTSAISICLNGTCRENQCECVPTRTYCGHQVYWMGWSNDGSKEQMAELNQCNIDGTKSVISKCKKCTSSVESAKCACIGTELFCGHELDDDPPYNDNSIYRCNNNGRAILIKECTRSCIRVSGVDRVPAVLPVCKGECVPDEIYCGSKLLTLGFTGYNNDSIYSCSKDGQNVMDTGRVDALCNKCTPGRSYCGHQLSPRQHLYPGDLETRFLCQSDGGLFGIQCSKCANTGAGAYCLCIPGWMYCGRQFYSKGWQGLGETVPFPNDFSNDTLFRCAQEDHIETVENCSKMGCVSTRRSNAYCLCTPGRTYCGHQLNPYYNSELEYLSPNIIYRCSNTRLRVYPVKECITCVTINGDPQCRQQCIHGSRYCGSDLLSLEGWSAMELNVLYQCSNGSFATPELNCTKGCSGKIGDIDAYCLGMPTPWYWFLLATGLPLMFISLSLWLIRTLIKHKRLQKFVQQHRINNSQLTLVQKLGEGQFGEVWQSRYTELSGHQMDVAVKISKHHLNTNPGQNLASANCFFQESVALDFLRHRNITRALGICSNLKMDDGMTTPALVLEYMDGGNSADYILKEREHLQTPDLMRIFMDICQAGEHLQKMGVIHRDIGARNVLIHKNPRNGKPAVAKLTDFGLAKDVGKAGLYRSTNPDRAMFHEGYTAPEGFRGDFSSQSDVWSFGVFMWEVYMLMDRNCSRPPVPYFDIASPNILREITNGYRLKRPHRAPTDIYSIMTSCWTWIPEARPVFRQLRKTLQVIRTQNGIEPDVELVPVELVPPEPCHVVVGGEQREEETAFSEQSSPNGGYGSPIGR